MEITKNNRMNPSLPFLSLEYVGDNTPTEKLDFSENGIENKNELITLVQKNYNDFITVGKRVNLFVGSLIENSEKESFLSDLRTLTELRDASKGTMSILSERLSGWIRDFCIYSGEIEKAFSQYSEQEYSDGLLLDYVFGRLIELSLRKPDSVPFDTIYDYLQLCHFTEYGSEIYASNSEIYAKAFCAVLPRTVEALYIERGRGFLYPQSKPFRRRAFQGLMCGSLSGVFEGEYVPFSENSELSEILGVVSRCTDNILRQGLGIKTRLPCASPSAELRRLALDSVREALPGFLPAPAKVGRKPKKPLEDAEKKGEVVHEPYKEPLCLDIDFAKAKKLEAESWRLAALMGGDYGKNDVSLTLDIEKYGEGNSEKATDETIENGTATHEAITEEGNNGCLSDDKANSEFNEIFGEISEEYTELFRSLSLDEIRILKCIAEGKDVNALARGLGGLALGFADSINEKATDTLGDIILDTSSLSPEFIEEYRDELCDILTVDNGGAKND